MRSSPKSSAFERFGDSDLLATRTETELTLHVDNIGQYLRLNNASPITVMVPAQDDDLASFIPLDDVTIEQAGAGAVTIAKPVAAKATGDLVFASQPDALSYLVLNGKTITFKVSGATGDDVDLAMTDDEVPVPDLAGTLTALADALNASTDPKLTVATYSATADTLHIEYDTAGAAGNAFSFSASADAHASYDNDLHLSGGYGVGTVDLRTALTLVTRAQYSVIRLMCVGVNEWVVSGDLAPV